MAMMFGQGVQERGRGRSSRLAVIFFLILLAVGNSFLFYFVIWPEFSPSDPFTAILFFVSGGAHLLYFFIPWFLIDVVGGAIGTGGDDPTRFDKDLGDDTTGFFLRLCTVVGGISIAIVVSLTLIKTFVPDKAPAPVTITRANCLQVGGIPRSTNGVLTCEFKTEQPGAAATAGSGDGG